MEKTIGEVFFLLPVNLVKRPKQAAHYFISFSTPPAYLWLSAPSLVIPTEDITL